MAVSPTGGSRLSAASGTGSSSPRSISSLRGEGDVFGTKQSGLPDFRVARLPEDYPLLERARRFALDLLKEDPELSSPENAVLTDAIAQRYGALDAEPIAA